MEARIASARQLPRTTVSWRVVPCVRAQWVRMLSDNIAKILLDLRIVHFVKC